MQHGLRMMLFIIYRVHFYFYVKAIEVPASPYAALLRRNGTIDSVTLRRKDGTFRYNGSSIAFPKKII